MAAKQQLLLTGPQTDVLRHPSKHRQSGVCVAEDGQNLENLDRILVHHYLSSTAVPDSTQGVFKSLCIAKAADRRKLHHHF